MMRKPWHREGKWLIQGHTALLGKVHGNWYRSRDFQSMGLERLWFASFYCLSLRLPISPPPSLNPWGSLRHGRGSLLLESVREPRDRWRFKSLPSGDPASLTAAAQMRSPQWIHRGLPYSHQAHQLPEGGGHRKEQPLPTPPCLTQQSRLSEDVDLTWLSRAWLSSGKIWSRMFTAALQITEEELPRDAGSQWDSFHFLRKTKVIPSFLLSW